MPAQGLGGLLSVGSGGHVLLYAGGELRRSSEREMVIPELEGHLVPGPPLREEFWGEQLEDVVSHLVVGNQEPAGTRLHNSVHPIPVIVGTRGRGVKHARPEELLEDFRRAAQRKRQLPRKQP